MAACRSCGERIVWVTMRETGRANPVNPDPDPERGNMRVIRVDGEPLARVLPAQEAAHRRELGERLFVSHFATCPKADRHRRRRGGR